MCRVYKILFLILVSLAVCQINSSANLLKDAGFESDSGEWQKQGSVPHMGLYSWHVKEGKKSMGFGNDDGPANASGVIYQDYKPEVPIKAGDIFCFEVWTESEGNYTGKAAVGIAFIDAEDNVIDSKKSDFVRGCYSWQKLRISSVAPEGVDKVRVSLLSEDMSTGHGRSFVWFDNANLSALAVKASSIKKDSALINLFDGSVNSLWHSDGNDNEWVEISFSQASQISGLAISWDKDYATNYNILFSEDGENWTEVIAAKKENPGKDVLYFEESSPKGIKIALNNSIAQQGYGIKEIGFIPAKEKLTLRDYFKQMAGYYPALYPRWMNEKQAYWTIVGLPYDFKESLICEDGTIEPFKKNFSIIPYLYVNNSLITREDAVISQALEDDCLPLPEVKWNCEDLELKVNIFAYGNSKNLGDYQKDQAVTYVSYVITNNRQENTAGKLFLVIRPFMVYPPWQGGVDGFAPIYEMSYSKDNVIRINDEQEIYPLVKPDNVSMEKTEINFPILIPSDDFKESLATKLEKGEVGSCNQKEDDWGFVSGVMEYSFDLAAGESKEIFFAVPLYEGLKPKLSYRMSTRNLRKGFDKMYKANVDYWRQQVNKVEIKIPEMEIVNTLKSNIAYNIITQDGPTLQPGSWSYDKGWMRDGSIQGCSMAKMGLDKEMKNFIDYMGSFQRDSGEIPPVVDNKADNPLWEEDEKGLIEYDSQGEYIWAVLQYYRFTKDKDFLEEKYENVKKSCDFMVHLSDLSKKDEYTKGDARKFYGLFPRSQSHEGYWREFSYWDDLWGIKGWEDAITIAQILGKDDDLDWMIENYNSFKKAVYDSIALTTQLSKLKYMPASASLSDFDPTATAAAIIYNEQLENLPADQIAYSFERYYNEIKSRFKPNAEYRFTPYEMRNVPAFLYIGQRDRSLELLRFMLKCRRPLAWNHLAEVVHSDYRFPTYIGDMPHSWVGAEYINAARSLFAYELDNKLVIADGIDTAWLKKGVIVKNMPTYYGALSYSMQGEADKEIIVKIESSLDSPQKGIILRIPNPQKVKNISAGNNVWQSFSGEYLAVCETPVTIKINYRP